MHVSDHSYETGNMRMYEIPAHGMMLVSDKAAANTHAQIFVPEKEALYYDNLADAIELIEYYLTHDNERIAIARSGYERYWRDYEWEANLQNFLKWAIGLRCEVGSEYEKK